MSFTQASLAPSTKSPLNSVDLALRTVDRAIRGMGYPGFETQTHVWLAGRLDAGRLRRSLAWLGRRYGEFSARLVEGDHLDRFSHWQLQPHAELELHEVELDSRDPGGVLAWAEQLQSTAHDPATSPLIRFYLLHRAGGRDVFVMQYSHVLMDHAAAGMVLRELARTATGEAAKPPRPADNHLLQGYLRRFSLAQRRAAAQGAIELHGHALRGRAAILGSGDETRRRQIKLRIAARCISSELTRAIHARTVALGGVPSLSMAILASTFRAIRQLGDERNTSDRQYVAGIGLDLGLRRGQTLLQNLLSIVPVVARPEELDDPVTPAVVLSRQLRQRLQSQIDLGVLRLLSAYQRRPRHIEWVVEHLLRWGYSLWYAYFGTDSIAKMGDVEVERISYVGPTWSPMGLSLLANQFRGQLHLQATYDPNLVPEPLAGALMDQLQSNLLDFALS
jgi:hypothetical protein